MPGFENGREELRTAESVQRDRRAMAGPDGDSRPLDEEIDPDLERALDEDRALRIERRLKDKDRAGLR